MALHIRVLVVLVNLIFRLIFLFTIENNIRKNRCFNPQSCIVSRVVDAAIICVGLLKF